MPDTGTFAGYGADGMYRLASMYYHGIPPAGSCTYKPYRLDGSLVYEQISFCLAGRRVIVSAYEWGFLVSFAEYDTGHRMVHYDHMSFHASGRPSFACPSAGETVTKPLTAPLVCYTSLLDDFVDASITLRRFSSPSPEDPAYLSACDAYSWLRCRLLSFVFSPGTRAQAEIVPKYLGEDHSFFYSIGECSCRAVVRSLDDYCPKCGVLLRWDCCCPA